jgi:hypothetical protein
MYSIRVDAESNQLLVALSGRVTTAEALRAVSQAFTLAEAGHILAIRCDTAGLQRGPAPCSSSSLSPPATDLLAVVGDGRRPAERIARSRILAEGILAAIQAEAWHGSPSCACAPRLPAPNCATSTSRPTPHRAPVDRLPPLAVPRVLPDLTESPGGATSSCDAAPPPDEATRRDRRPYRLPRTRRRPGFGVVVALFIMPRVFDHYFGVSIFIGETYDNDGNHESLGVSRMPIASPAS